MDRRVVFFFVFMITLCSTLLVAFVCFFTGQSAVESVLYTLATMWVMGVISQLLLTNLYQAIIRPLEHERKEKQSVRDDQQFMNLEEVEEIDQVTQAVNAQARQHAEKGLDEQPLAVGKNVEQKG